MLTHSFYGAKYLTTLRLQPNEKPIKTLGELFKVLLSCWSKDTANPAHNEKWNRANPTVAQSDVTSMLLCDMFGGTIHKIEVDGFTHYFNMINGNYIDFTREQFEISKTPIAYEGNVEVTRASLNDDEAVTSRYKLLLKRISDYLAV